MTSGSNHRHSDAQSGRIRELRAAGWALQKIAREVGVSYQAVRKAVDPQEHTARLRFDNAKRGAAKRKWEQENDRPLCPRCGGKMAVGAHRKGYELCGACRQQEADQRLEEIIRLRSDESATNIEIAQRLKTTPEAIAEVFLRARRAGIDVPQSPYHANRREVMSRAV